MAMIAAVGAIVVGATTAYFSDTETSIGNTFTAGTIDIAIDGKNPFIDHFDIGDLKPGEVGYINFNIQNVGQNPVNVSKKLYDFTYTDSNPTGYDCSQLYSGVADTSSEPECVAEAGTVVNNVETQILYDLSVEVYASDSANEPTWWQTIYAVDGTGDKSLYDVYGTAGTQYVALGMIPVGGHMLVTQSYHFSANAGNVYQGDGLTFNMEIKADQLPQGAEGQATVTLENKTAGPEYAIIADGYQGVLTYKTSNPTFDFSFTGKVTQNSTQYTLLYAVDPWPQTGSKVLGTVTSGTGGDVVFSGTATPGDITNGKVWLVLSSDWGTNQMIGWHQADYLLETGLINYVQN